MEHYTRLDYEARGRFSDHTHTDAVSLVPVYWLRDIRRTKSCSTTFPARSVSKNK